MANLSKIKELAEELKFSSIATEYVDLRAEEDSHLEFLERVFQIEYDLRSASALDKRTTKSKLPFRVFRPELVNATIRWQIEGLEKLHWLEDNQNVMIIGKCNTGKTSLAVHLAKLALEEGHNVYYTTVYELIETIMRKGNSANSKRVYNYMMKCDLVILDDVMYTGMTPDELRQFYHAAMYINESSSMIVITNRELSTWADATDDYHVVETIIERITGNCQIVRV